MCSGDATMHCTDNPQRGDGSDAGGSLLSVDRCACGFPMLGFMWATTGCVVRSSGCGCVFDHVALWPTFFGYYTGVAEAL